MDCQYVKCGGSFIKKVAEINMEQQSYLSEEMVKYNRIAHDLVAEEYDAKHIEIFNPTEQKRIQATLCDACKYLGKDFGEIKALDFGSGTGNLTKHLLELGLEVTSADVSSVCLAKVDLKFNSIGRLTTLVLNGKDLDGIPDDSFDLVATYSVLHHVPDYLSVIDEFMRVTKPGGIILIDHEVCPSYWLHKNEYLAYLNELGWKFYSDHLYELGLMPEGKGGTLAKLIAFVKNSLMLCAGKMLSNYKHESEQMAMISDGDIHVFINDHIEWNAIRTRLRLYCDVLSDEEYLVCRERAELPPVWNKWCDKVTDMNLIMVRKR